MTFKEYYFIAGTINIFLFWYWVVRRRDHSSQHKEILASIAFVPMPIRILVQFFAGFVMIPILILVFIYFRIISIILFFKYKYLKKRNRNLKRNLENFTDIVDKLKQEQNNNTD